jgi:hypothetical protein
MESSFAANHLSIPMASQGLFLFFEGLAATVIDSQVLILARELKDNGLSDLEIWSFACSPRKYADSLARLMYARHLSRCTVKVFRGIPPSLPFSPLFNFFIVSFHLIKNRKTVEVIHARTDYSAAVCGLLKFFKSFQLIWDCRGDAEAEFRTFYQSRNIVERFYGWVQILQRRWLRHMAAAFCDRAIFVSAELKKAKGYGIKKKVFKIIPSTASEKIFYYDEQLRRKTREKLGYSEKNTLFLFSGSLSSYQCFSESIDLFTHSYVKDPDCRLLILTPESSKAKERLAALPQETFFLGCATYEEMNAYLNASDFGFLMRREDPLNRVAAPTKYAEYCLTGLPVIMTKSIPHYYDLAKKHKNLCEIIEGEIHYIQVNRKEISETYRNIVSLQSVWDKYVNIYSPKSAENGSTLERSENKEIR